MQTVFKRELGWLYYNQRKQTFKWQMLQEMKDIIYRWKVQSVKKIEKLKHVCEEQKSCSKIYEVVRKYMKSTLTQLKEEINSCTVIHEDFNIPLSVMNRTMKQRTWTTL